MPPLRLVHLTVLTLSIAALAFGVIAEGSGPVGAASSAAASTSARPAHVSGVHAPQPLRPGLRHMSATSLKGVRSETPAATASGATSSAYDTLVHHFTFSGTKVDDTVWGVYNTNGPWSTDRDARRPELVTVANDMLHVSANGPQGSGLCLCRKAVKPTSPYGRYEIRARASANVDHGFAIMLWPNSDKWPTDGEIDIAEYDSARSKLWTTVHYGATNKRYITGTPGDFTQWHTYGVDWSPKSIVYYVDGVTVLTVTDQAAIPRDAMHLVLQAGKNQGVKNPSNTSTTLDVAWIDQYD